MGAAARLPNGRAKLCQAKVRLRQEYRARARHHAQAARKEILSYALGPCAPRAGKP